MININKLFNSKTWDNSIQDRADMNHIDQDTIEKVKNNTRFRMPQLSEYGTKEVIRQFGLLTEVGLTKAALVLFGKKLRKFNICDHLIIERYNNDGKIFSRKISGNLIQILNKTMAQLNNEILFKYSGIVQKKLIVTPEYPIFLLYELLINALIHRDYEVNKPIKIQIFPDHLSIWNPGSFSVKKSLVELMKFPESSCRNPLIAKTSIRIGKQVGLGHGINNITDICSDFDLLLPNYNCDKNGVKVTIQQTDLYREKYLQKRLMIYRKPPLTIRQQIFRMKKRGIKVPNRKFAKDFLKKVEYYRLKPYRRMFWVEIAKLYAENTSFLDIVNLYKLDEELKLKIIEALAQIEIFLRDSASRFLANKRVGGVKHPFVHENKEIIANFSKYKYHVINKLHNKTKSLINGKYNDPNVNKYTSIFRNYPSLPIWMAVEVSTFDVLSKLLGGLHKNICEEYIDYIKFNEFKNNKNKFNSFVHAFVVLRNICAHYSPLVCRKEMSIKVSKPIIEKWDQVDETSLGSLLYAINQFLKAMPDTEEFRIQWKIDIEKLLSDYSQLDIKSDIKIDIFDLIKFDINHILWV